MSTTKAPNVKTQILQTLYEHGAKDTSGLLEFIKNAQRDSVHSKALELMHDGYLTRDANMVWSLAEGITPQSLTKGDDQGESPEKGGKPGGAGQTAGAPLDAKGQFEELLKSVAVKPTEIIPTLAKLFFTGDIDDIKWLAEVLKRHGAGWVQPNQIRLVISTWSKSRGLPFDESEFDVESGEVGKGAKAEAKEQPKTGAAKVLEDAGIGWKVGKDRDGDWIAQPGGTMSLEEATAAAERRATIAAMKIGEPETLADEPSASGEGKPAAKGVRSAVSFQDKLMDKVLDAFIDGKTGKDSEDSPIIKELRQQNQTLMTTVQQMKDQQDRDWKERIEANIAAMAANDPWSDPVQVARIRQAIGYQTSAVTDSSPAVQLIKDGTDKMDKNVSRLTGLIERMVLQGDVFRPEETRTAQEKESKAGALLSEAAGRQRSVELRKRVFDV